jgi:transposase-like protein
MPRRSRISEEKEAAILAALERVSNASLVARESEGEWSYSTVWRIADRHDFALTAGRETMGRKRLSAEQRASVLAAIAANPQATQEQIAGQTGVSRPSVSRIEGGRRRPRGRSLQAG